MQRDFIDALWSESQQVEESEWKSLARRRLATFEEQLHEGWLIVQVLKVLVPGGYAGYDRVTGAGDDGGSCCSAAPQRWRRGCPPTLEGRCGASAPPWSTASPSPPPSATDT